MYIPIISVTMLNANSVKVSLVNSKPSDATSIEYFAKSANSSNWNPISKPFTDATYNYITYNNLDNQVWYFKARFKSSTLISADSDIIAVTLSTDSYNLKYTVKDNIKPTPPSRLDYSILSDSVVVCYCTGATDNCGVAGYKWYANGVYKATTATSMYSFRNLTGLTLYKFEVSSIDSSGNESNKIEISVTTPNSIKSYIENPFKVHTYQVLIGELFEEDISDYIENLNVNVKFSGDNYMLNIIDPSEAHFTLMNSDGYWNNRNLEKIPIKILSGYDGNLREIFKGYFRLGQRQVKQRTIEVTAQSYFYVFKKSILNKTVLENQRPEQLIQLACIECKVSEYELTNTEIILPIIDLNEYQTWADLIKVLCESMLYIFNYEDGRFYFRPLFTSSEQPQYTFTANNIEDLTQFKSIDTIKNIIEIESNYKSVAPKDKLTDNLNNVVEVQNERYVIQSTSPNRIKVVNFPLYKDMELVDGEYKYKTDSTVFLITPNSLNYGKKIYITDIDVVNGYIYIEQNLQDQDVVSVSYKYQQLTLNPQQSRTYTMELQELGKNLQILCSAHRNTDAFDKGEEVPFTTIEAQNTVHLVNTIQQQETKVKFTLKNNTPDIVTLSTLMIAGNPIKSFNPIQARFRNSTSINQWDFESTLSIKNDLIVSENQAKTVGNFLYTNLANPVERITIPVPYHIPYLNLGKIKVTETSTGINYDFLVVDIGHNLDDFTTSIQAIPYPELSENPEIDWLRKDENGNYIGSSLFNDTPISNPTQLVPYFNNNSDGSVNLALTWNDIIDSQSPVDGYDMYISIKTNAGEFEVDYQNDIHIQIRPESRGLVLRNLPLKEGFGLTEYYKYYGFAICPYRIVSTSLLSTKTDSFTGTGFNNVFVVKNLPLTIPNTDRIVKVNGVIQTEGLDYDVNVQTGEFVFKNNPAINAEIEITYKYSYPEGYIRGSLQKFNDYYKKINEFELYNGTQIEQAVKGIVETTSLSILNLLINSVQKDKTYDSSVRFDDFRGVRVLANTGNGVIDRAVFGQFKAGYYGLQINDGDGTEVFRADQNGLFMQGTLLVGSQFIDDAGVRHNISDLLTDKDAPNKDSLTITATANDNGTVSLLWSGFEDLDSGIGGYNVWRKLNATDSPVLLQTLYSGSSNNTSYTDTTTQHNTTYMYYVTAFDNSGNETSETETDANGNIIGWVSILALKKIYPLPPSMLTATGRLGRIDLEWSTNKNITSYRIEKSIDNGATFLPLAIVQGTSYSEYNISAPKDYILSYRYRIKSIDKDSGLESQDWTTTATINNNVYLPADGTAPNAPTNLILTPDNDGRVTISWTKSTSTDISKYRVYRKDSPTAEFVSIIETSSLNYIDTYLKPTITYYYQVTSIDTSGMEGLPSETKSCVAIDSVAPSPPIPTAVGMFGSIKLTWTEIAEQGVVYEVWRCGEVWLDSSATKIATVASSGKDSGSFLDYDPPTFTPTTYTYKLKVKDKWGNTSAFLVDDSIKKIPAKATSTIDGVVSSGGGVETNQNGQIVKIDADQGITITAKSGNIKLDKNGLIVSTKLNNVVSEKVVIGDISSAKNGSQYGLWVDGGAIRINGGIDVGRDLTANTNTSASSRLLIDSNGIRAYKANVTTPTVTIGSDGNVTILGGTIRTGVATTGARIEMNSTGLYAYNASGTQTFKLSSTDGSVEIGSGQITAGDVGARPDDWTPTASDVGALSSSYAGRLTKLTSEGVYTGTLTVDKVTGWTEKAFLKLFDNPNGACALDATNNTNTGTGTSIRLKWDDRNYVYVANNYIGFYFYNTTSLTSEPYWEWTPTQMKFRGAEFQSGGGGVAVFG